MSFKERSAEEMRMVFHSQFHSHIVQFDYHKALKCSKLQGHKQLEQVQSRGLEPSLQQSVQPMSTCKLAVHLQQVIRPQVQVSGTLFVLTLLVSL